MENFPDFFNRYYYCDKHKNYIVGIFKSHSPWAEGLPLMEIPFSVCLLVCDNFEPCDWSDCPKGCLSLVETGNNVSEDEQVLGSRGECYLQYKSTQTGVDR
jgi:hypothetical protein